MKPSILLLLISILSSTVYSQTDTVTQFDLDYSHRIYSLNTVDNKLRIYFGSDNSTNKLVSIDLETGDTSVLREKIPYQQSFVRSENGEFYVEFRYNSTGNGGRYYIVYQPDSGPYIVSQSVITIPSAINSTRPRFALVHNGKYYICVQEDAGSAIWESDGSASGTVKRASFANPVTGMTVVNGKVLILTKSMDDYHVIYTIEEGGQLGGSFGVLTSDYPEFNLISYGGDLAFFSAKSASGVYKVFRTNEQLTDLTLFMDSARAASVTTTGNEFQIHFYNEGTFRGQLNDPENLTAVVRVGVGFEPLQYQSFPFGSAGLYGVATSVTKGVELGRYISRDTLQLVKDLIKGPGSGFLGLMTRAPDSTLYFLASNGSRPFIGKVSGLDVSPLFFIGNSENVARMFVEGDYIYWMESKQFEYFRLYRRLLTDTEEVSLEIPQNETWFRELAMLRRSTFTSGMGYNLYNHGLFTDSEGSAIAGFSISQTTPSSMRFGTNYSDSSRIIQGRDVHVKYDKYGNLLWTSSMGSIWGDLDDDGEILGTTNDDIIVTGQFTKRAVFGTDTVIVPHTANYVAKLDNQSGEIIWRRILTTLVGNKHANIYNLTTDEHGNIYMSVLFHGNSLTIDGQTITSEASPSNALLKLNDNGQLVWLKNISAPSDEFGKGYVLKYSKSSGKILLIRSQGYYNVWSSCDYSDWTNYVQMFDTDGNILSSYSYITDDLGGVPAGEILPDGKIFLNGYFRGNLEIGDYDVTTDPKGNCYYNEGYNVIYDPSDNRPVSLTTSSSGRGFYPVSSVFRGNNCYVVGTDNSKKLLILKFTSTGQYEGYLPLNQMMNVSEFNQRHNFLDVRDGYITLLSNQFRKDEIHNVNPVISNGYPQSLLRIEDAGWIADDYFGRVSLPIKWFDGKEDFVVYPNQFKKDLYIKFKNADHGYGKFELRDLNGKIIAIGSFNDKQYQQFDFENIGQGLFFLRITGASGEKVVKVVHE